MDTPPVTVDYDRSGRQLTVYLTGALDEETAPPLSESIIQHITPDDEEVRIDVAGVTACDPDGASLLLGLHDYVGGLGGRLTIYCPSPCLEQVLTACGVDRALSIWSQPAAAQPRP